MKHSKAWNLLAILVISGALLAVSAYIFNEKIFQISLDPFNNNPVNDEKTTQDTLFFDFHENLSKRNPLLFKDHELLDSVILSVEWSEVEPMKGVFEFGTLDALIRQRSEAGDHIVLRVAPYGQSQGNTVTPEWIYDTVPKITLASDKRGVVSIPKVWEESFIEEYERFVQALAKKYDQDSRVQYIQIGVGHIGFITAQPSPEGSEAFLEAGWTISLWEEYIKKVVDIYQDNFQNKKLIITMTPLFLKNESLVMRLDAGKHIAEYAALKGYYISFKGVDQAPDTFSKNGFEQVIKHLAALKQPGLHLGFGDDWPLLGPTGNHVRTEEDFQAILDNIYNLWVSIDKIYPIYITVLDNELAASETGNSKFNVEVQKALTDFIAKVRP